MESGVGDISAIKGTIVEEQVRLHEDGMDFIGPIQLAPGSTLEISVSSSAHWGIDSYLVDETTGLQILYHHFDPSRHNMPQTAPLAANNGSGNWDTTYRARSQQSVWVILDNSDLGYSMPPTNMEDDILLANVTIRVR